MLARFFPILEWGRTYNSSVLSNDLMAAVIVTIMLIPQSLAYALLAGLPPVALATKAAGSVARRAWPRSTLESQNLYGLRDEFSSRGTN